jgi:Acetyltransferase (GNAT) domain
MIPLLAQALGHAGRHERPGRDPPEHVVVPREQLAQLGADVGLRELWRHRARQIEFSPLGSATKEYWRCKVELCSAGLSPRTPAALRRALCRGSGAPICVAAPTVKSERVRSCRGPPGLLTHEGWTKHPEAELEATLPKEAPLPVPWLRLPANHRVWGTEDGHRLAPWARSWCPFAWARGLNKSRSAPVQESCTREAARALIRWAFEQPGVHCVTAHCDQDNVVSQRVVQKAGMTPRGVQADGRIRFETE